MNETEQIERKLNEAAGRQTPSKSLAEGPLAEGPADFAGRPSDSEKETDQLTTRTHLSNWTVLAMIVLCFFVIVRFRPFTARSTGEGQTLSQLKLQPLTVPGPQVTLADLTGRVVLINFWEARSAASRKALPHLAAMNKQFGGRSAFRLLSVSCGRSTKEDFRSLREETRAALDEARVDFPTYGDPGGISRSAVEQAAGLSDYPTTLALDRRGRIRKVWTGYQPGMRTEMQQLIAGLLNER